MKRLTVRLSDETLAKLTKMAKKAKRTLSAQIAFLVDFSTDPASNGVILTPNGVTLTPPPQAPSNVQSLEVKQPLKDVEVQTSTSYGSSTTTRAPEDSGYTVPSWKTDPVTCLVISFKTLKGVPHEDRAWDKIHFARNAAPAKKLLDVCGDFKTADQCLVAISTELKNKGFPWSFETVLRQAHEWLAKERKQSNGTQYRQRLFDHLARQHAAPGLTQVGAAIPVGSVLDRLRDLSAVPDKSGRSNSTGSGSGNEKPVDGLRETPVEKSPDRKQPA
jgi:hypothetical protein